MTKNKRIIFAGVFLFILAAMFIAFAFYPAGDIALLESAFFSQTISSTTSGSTTENIILNFAALDGLNAQDKQTLMSSSLSTFTSKKTDLVNEYNAKILAEPITQQPYYAGQFSVSTLTEGDQVIFRITYNSQAAWQFFTSKSGYSYTPVNVYRFFDYSRYDRQEKIGSVSTIGGQEQYLADYLKDLAYDEVDTFDTNLLENLEVKSVYAYVTLYRRRHTNADEISFYNESFFHQWDTTTSEDIAFYVNYPRVEIWYILSLALALSVVGVVTLISYFKNDGKKPTQDMEVIDMIDVGAEQLDTDNQENEEIKRIKTKDE